MKPSVTITYCVGCNWLLRAGWMAQELLSTFKDDLAGVTIAPADVPGTYNVAVNETVIWDRKRDGGFPEAKELKKRLRDVIEPERNLGHLDRSN